MYILSISQLFLEEAKANKKVIRIHILEKYQKLKLNKDQSTNLLNQRPYLVNHTRHLYM